MARNKSAAVATAAVGLLGLVGITHAATIYGLTTDNNLFRVDSAAPGTILGGTFITGLQSNETLVGIDFRPVNNVLYGVGSSSRVYTINTTTGAATAVGGAFTPGINGANFDIDFNPVPDAIRFVSDADQNLRLSPVTGAALGTDANLNGSVDPNIAGVAYTNNFGGATSTTLYGIDSGTDSLVIINPPNSGTITNVPGAGLGLNVTSVAGFDILTTTGPTVDTGYAALQPVGSSASGLYTINLTTGAASLVGQFGGGFVVKDLAVVVPEPITTGMAGLMVLGLVIRRR